jgi:hypothetical protein
MLTVCFNLKIKQRVDEIFSFIDFNFITGANDSARTQINLK